METIARENISPVVDEKGNYIINENTILLGNITTQEYFYVPLTEEVVSEFNINTCEKNVKDELKDEKIWNRENVLFLIDMYKKFDREFSCGMKKNAWEKVAAACQQLNKNITAKQCETKWKTLKRTYTNIKCHNNTSGHDKKYWEFYDLMHQILFKKPEIEAVATCSSITGLSIQGEKKAEVLKTNQEENTSENTMNDTENIQFESNFSKKRKQRISDAERRHNDKMKRLDKFNEIFEKMVEKIPGTDPETDKKNN